MGPAFQVLKDKYVYSGLMILTLSYLPGVLLTTAWSDEYPAMKDPWGLSQELMEAMRPVWSLLALITFTTLPNPGLLWIARLFGFLGLITLYLSLVKFTPKVTKTASAELFVALALCLPSFQNWGHWANAWPQSWAAVISVWSFYFFKKQKLFYKILGILMLTVSITTYPPSSVFFFGALAVNSYEKQVTSKSIRSEIIAAVKLITGATLVSLIICELLLKILGLQRAPRASFVNPSEIGQKISWLFTRPVVVGLRFFSIDSPTIFLAAVSSIPAAFIILFTILRQSSALREKRFQRALLFAMYLGMSISPIILTRDNQIEHRFIPGYAFAIFCLFCLALREIISKISSKIPKNKYTSRALPLFMIFISVIIIINTNWRFYQGFYHPYQVKTTFIAAALNSCSKESLQSGIEIIPPKKKFPIFNRIGSYSQSTDMDSSWVPEPNVWLLLPKLVNQKTNIHYPGNSHLNKNCHIDLEILRKALL